MAFVMGSPTYMMAGVVTDFKVAEEGVLQQFPRDIQAAILDKQLQVGEEVRVDNLTYQAGNVVRLKHDEFAFGEVGAVCLETASSSVCVVVNSLKASYDPHTNTYSTEPTDMWRMVDVDALRDIKPLHYVSHACGCCKCVVLECNVDSF